MVKTGIFKIGPESMAAPGDSPLPLMEIGPCGSSETEGNREWYERLKMTTQSNRAIPGSKHSLDKWKQMLFSGLVHNDEPVSSDRIAISL